LRYVRYLKGGQVRYGLVEDGTIIEIDGDPFTAYQLASVRYRLGEVKILPPTEPSKIIALGLNYREHAEEVKLPIPEEPLIFFKAPSALIGHEDTILLPSTTDRIDYEAELVVVIKDRIKGVSEEEAMAHILGFTCGNDVSHRSIQRKDGQWARAKSFDTFAPVGPYIATGLDPASLSVELRLNGELKQSSNTRNLIFGIPLVVSFISRVMTLMPGDLIFTGTPSGIGRLKPGDVVEVTIEGVGTLRNPVTLAE